MPDTLHTTRTDDGAVLRVVIDNPPLNLLSAELLLDLDRVLAEVEADSEVRVVVFDSADPDFFVPHGDMAIALDPQSFMELPVAPDQPAELNPMLRVHERVRALPPVTIGVLRGLARGGGAELLSAMDLRYASLERGGLAQMEAPTGIIPGAGGTAYLAQLVGRARALEIVLGARLIDARTAEQWGWVNRAVPDAHLDAYVDALASDIAALLPGVITSAKTAIDAALTSMADGLSVENAELGARFADPRSSELSAVALAAGAQTRAGEIGAEAISDVLRARSRELRAQRLA